MNACLPPKMSTDRVRVPFRASKRAFSLVGIFACLFSSANAEGPLPGSATCEPSFGEVVYVPAMSRVGTQQNALQPLASTMVIHNVDTETTIFLKSVDLYDQSGTKIGSLLSKNISLPPFSSENFISAIDDDRPGIGANFLLEWSSDKPACSPEVMSVMIGGTGVHGFSFSLPGRVISRFSASP